MLEKVTPIVLAFTPNYLVPAATTILSILNSDISTSVYEVICLLAKPLSKDKRRQLEKINNTRLVFSYINLYEREFDIYVDDRYTIAASYRLLLPELLPHHKNIIYIDCDIIVRNNLAALYENINLEGFYMAGVFEATLDFQMGYMNSIGVNPRQYVNSGFLVMNLELLRKDNMVPQFLEASKQVGLQFPDQDVINQLCRGKILGLSPIYNSIRTFFLPQYKPDFLKKYSEVEWEKVQLTGNIHYTGGKPWDTYTVKFERWWDTFMLLPASLKREFDYNAKMYYLYRMHKYPFVKRIFEISKAIWRYIKS